ncbi:Transcription elongation factor 1 [Yarrowia sp. B02]|nr:Transcription elongation factor 1 [Yarrowia sp. B02]
MGKRKSSSAPAKKVKQTLATQFACLFCNHNDSVVCSMDKKMGIGNLSCKVCGQSFQASINALSAPIDVYSEWIDACEAVAEQEKNKDDDFVEKDGGYDDDEDHVPKEEDDEFSDLE